MVADIRRVTHNIPYAFLNSLILPYKFDWTGTPLWTKNLCAELFYSFILSCKVPPLLWRQNSALFRFGAAESVWLDAVLRVWSQLRRPRCRSCSLPPSAGRSAQRRRGNVTEHTSRLHGAYFQIGANMRELVCACKTRRREWRKCVRLSGRRDRVSPIDPQNIKGRLVLTLKFILERHHHRNIIEILLFVIKRLAFIAWQNMQAHATCILCIAKCHV